MSSIFNSNHLRSELAAAKAAFSKAKAAYDHAIIAADAAANTRLFKSRYFKAKSLARLVLKLEARMFFLEKRVANEVSNNPSSKKKRVRKNQISAPRSIMPQEGAGVNASSSALVALSDATKAADNHVQLDITTITEDIAFIETTANSGKANQAEINARVWSNFSLPHRIRNEAERRAEAEAAKALLALKS